MQLRLSGLDEANKPYARLVQHWQPRLGPTSLRAQCMLCSKTKDLIHLAILTMVTMVVVQENTVASMLLDHSLAVPQPLRLRRSATAAICAAGG